MAGKQDSVISAVKKGFVEEMGSGISAGWYTLTICFRLPTGTNSKRARCFGMSITMSDYENVGMKVRDKLQLLRPFQALSAVLT